MQRLVSSLALASLTAMGCGAATKTVVEGDMRFEHCYRIDEDPRIAADQKRACWASWNTYFTRGQDRSRVDYARARLVALDTSASLPAPATAAPTAVACPPPTSPYAPPPPVLREGAAFSAKAEPLWQSCGDACARDWRGCTGSCTAGSACTNICDERYRGCMKACL